MVLETRDRPHPVGGMDVTAARRGRIAVTLGGNGGAEPRLHRQSIGGRLWYSTMTWPDFAEAIYALAVRSINIFMWGCVIGRADPCRAFFINSIILKYWYYS